MTRVALVIGQLGLGGAEKQLVLLAQHLPRDEFDVHVCAISESGELACELERSGIPVSVIGKRWKLTQTLSIHISASPPTSCIKASMMKPWLSCRR